MKRQSAYLFIVAILALFGPLAQNGRCYFVLHDSEQLTVNSFQDQGTLYDTSRAFIVSGGILNYKLWAYDYSTVDMSGGYVDTLYAYDYSTVNISGGESIGGNGPLNSLYALEYSTVNISGGSVGSFLTYDSVTVNISGGSVTYLNACNSSTVDISGGSVSSLQVQDSVTVNISGGSVGGLVHCQLRHCEYLRWVCEQPLR